MQKKSRRLRFVGEIRVRQFRTLQLCNAVRLRPFLLSTAHVTDLYHFLHPPMLELFEAKRDH